MRMFPLNRCSLVFAALICVASTARAQQPLTVENVLAIAGENNPSLNAARTDAKKAGEQSSSEEARFPWLLSLRAAPGITQTPSLNSAGATNSSYSEGIDLSGALIKPFSQGTELSFEVGASADRRRAPILPTEQEPLLLGPGYGLMARVGLRHPFLRGGRDVTENALRSARIRKEGADAARDRQASEVSRDVLVAYWELWYAEQSVAIDEASLELARRTLADAQARIEEGALAEVDSYAFEIRVASLEESVASSRVEHNRREIELRKLLGGYAGPLSATEAPREFRLPNDLKARALVASPQLAEIDADLALARNSVLIAHDATRPRLNVEASVTSRGLGNKALGPAVDGVFGADGLSASVSVLFETPLNSSSVRADEAAAHLSVEAAEWRRRSFEQQLAAEIQTQEDRHAMARSRILLSNRTFELALKQAAAERERLEVGATIPLQVLEAESSLRDSQLRVARARIDATVAQIALLHLSGELLAQLSTIE